VVQEISLFKQLPQAEQYCYTILSGTPVEGNSFTTNITPPHFMKLACESSKEVVATVNPLPVSLIAVSYITHFILSK
jgi:hypothetical protein